jgi:hypothetical protein
VCASALWILESEVAGVYCGHKSVLLKGLGHEIDFKKFDKNVQIRIYI